MVRFKHRSKFEYGLEQIHIAPLITVIFQLLIFFMLSLPFTSQTGIEIALPKAITSDVINDKNFIITVTGENILYWNNAVITIEELGRELKKSFPKNQPILIKSDRRAYVGRIVDVWDLCRWLGIEKINIVTNQQE